MINYRCNEIIERSMSDTNKELNYSKILPVISDGFLLTRQSQDHKDGIHITFWLKTKSGPVKLSIANELAVFFIHNEEENKAKAFLSQQHIHCEKITTLKLKSFSQKLVSGFYFKSMRDLYAARDILKQQSIKCYEDDFRPDERYLMERFITSSVNFIGTEQTLFSDKANNSIAYQSFIDVRCKPSNTEITLTMVSLDIECAMTGELYSIGLYSDKCQQVFMINDDQSAKQPSEEHQYITWVKDEKTLLLAFIQWLQVYDPDIIIGWNVINFDMDLMQKRCDFHGLKFTIGRDGSSPYWRKNQSSEQKYLEIAGRVVLDGIDLLKTATYNFPSFSLDNVANTLLGIGKIVTDVDNRIEEITDNFHHNKLALAAYNLDDCRLVWLIYEKTDLLNFAMLRSKLTGLAIDRTGGSVAAFTNLYLPKLHRSGYVAPNMGDGESDLISPGGYVMDSIPGLYENVLVLDFKSLYPSIIRTFKIDPMGLIEGLRSPEQAIPGFDGALFSRSKHFLPDIIESLWLERDKAKLEQNAALSQAIKIIMNSFYGILGSTGCRFFDPRLAGSITKRSHVLLKMTKQWIEGKGYQVIYGDTDSIFVAAGADKTLIESRELGTELQNFINKEMDKTLSQEFSVESTLEIEFETHFSKFLMPTIRGSEIGTKKRYAGMIINKNTPSGIDEQQMVFKGLETVRTDWTDLAKVFQQALYKKVFNKEPVRDYIKFMVEKTQSGEYDHLLIYRKRIRRKLNEYVKNVPPHVKAARLADMYNNEQGKPLRYQNKGWIEYYMTLNGPQAKEHLSAPLDYQLYIDRQLAVVADAILPFIGLRFSQIVDAQFDLFSS
jgi:DNA polymerase-2